MSPGRSPSAEARFVVMLLVVAATAVPAAAQSTNETLLLARAATTNGAYHLVEAIHQRGRIVPLDVGYIDFDDPALYREMWVGAGGVPLQGPKGFLITEGLLARAFGYSAYKFGDEPWRHKPFITATFKAGTFGNVELWVQRVPADHVALQFRYAKVFVH